MLCSRDNPCTHEFKGNVVGTSLASTVRSLWDQGGHDCSTLFEEEDVVDDDLVAKLVKEIENEKVSPQERCRWHENGLQRSAVVRMYKVVVVVVCATFIKLKKLTRRI